MYEVELLNLKTNEKFTKIFWNLNILKDFIRKCEYSKKVKVITITDNSMFYD